MRQLSTGTRTLYPGSQFRGKQSSGAKDYEVVINLQHVDLEDSYLCGYLHIHNLTLEIPGLTTFFDTEVIRR
ncbi:hypothetical protein K493DRAFT_391091 [Basidiobolus meristosporus CBS 931.73]|uniref:Uncharacterized protein n=1 Tax=Basidiobolus meristosporus CBS 931.73 TaxID=1314790 RepID=A0A1Y1X198_9FUNG|nr:hypothetical protein K493DRAFT_391091 [Basidiobolus meristosporus CBS 931.73]|eukprot:ORX79114.1 hypothetical protein K493DRAFT_391091 [Basidiobolus meristosporus CBS 931.73]